MRKEGGRVAALLITWEATNGQPPFRSPWFTPVPGRETPEAEGVLLFSYLLLHHLPRAERARHGAVREPGVELADQGTGLGNDAVNSRHAPVEGGAE